MTSLPSIPPDRQTYLEHPQSIHLVALKLLRMCKNVTTSSKARITTLCSSIKHFTRHYKVTLSCTDNAFALKSYTKCFVNPPHCFYSLMIGSTAEYQHQINSGVLINTVIHCGYRAQAECLSTEGMATTAVTTPISRGPVEGCKDNWSSGDAAVP